MAGEDERKKSIIIREEIAQRNDCFQGLGVYDRQKVLR